MNSAAFPRASLWLMRRYLEHPWMLPVRASLVEEFKKIRKRSPGLTMFRDRVTRLIWDALLRHHGLGRGGALRAVFQVPDFQDISSDFRVDVHIGGSVRGNTEEAEKALSWCLSSLYLYMEDLGLYGENQEEGE